MVFWSRVLLVHGAVHSEVTRLCVWPTPSLSLLKPPTRCVELLLPMTGVRDALSWGRIYGGMESIFIFHPSCCPF